MKNPLWKQPTPQMQYIAVLASLDGWVALAEDTLEDGGEIRGSYYIPKIRDHVEQLRALIPFIEGTERW